MPAFNYEETLCTSLAFQMIFISRWHYHPYHSDFHKILVTFLKYNGLPINIADAKGSGWTQISSCQGTVAKYRVLLDIVTCIILIVMKKCFCKKGFVYVIQW